MRFTLSQRVAVLAKLIQALHRAHSWCGETHVQKAVYFLQNTGDVPLEYNYILYKHGPYSFNLTEDLGTMRGAGFTELAIPVAGYGPSIRLTRLAEDIFLSQDHDDAVEAVTPIIEHIVGWLGAKDVRSLERVATAYYVLQENPTAEPQSRAQRLRKLKPHISEGESIAAVRELDEKLSVMAQ